MPCEKCQLNDGDACLGYEPNAKGTDCIHRIATSNKVTWWVCDKCGYRMGNLAFRRYFKQICPGCSGDILNFNPIEVEKHD